MMKEYEVQKMMLAIELDKFDLESRKVCLELERRSNEQEIIRRNIEVCNSVLKVSNVCKCNEIENEVLTKISKLIKKLED